MPVSDLARTDPVTATPDDPIEDVAATMRDEKVGSVIVEDERAPVGIVTDRDLALRALADGADAERAADVMTEDLCCVDADAGVFELTQAMCDNGVRRIPVLDGDELSGIVTLDDLHRLFSDEQENLAAVIAAESPPY